MKHLQLRKLTQIARMLTEEGNKELSPYHIYMSQWTLLRALNECGKSTQAHLADYVAVERPAITHTIKRLEEMGFVQRETGKDQREKIVSLTEAGKKSIPILEEILNNHTEDVLSILTEEETKQFDTLMTKLLDHLKERQGK